MKKSQYVEGAVPFFLPECPCIDFLSLAKSYGVESINAAPAEELNQGSQLRLARQPQP
jgi:hypothetical protein